MIAIILIIVGIIVLMTVVSTAMRKTPTKQSSQADMVKEIAELKNALNNKTQ